VLDRALEAAQAQSEREVRRWHKGVDARIGMMGEAVASVCETAAPHQGLIAARGTPQLSPTRGTIARGGRSPAAAAAAAAASLADVPSGIDALVNRVMQSAFKRDGTAAAAGPANVSATDILAAIDGSPVRLQAAAAGVPIPRTPMSASRRRMMGGRTPASSKRKSSRSVSGAGARGTPGAGGAVLLASPYQR
jgi:hypothetical protein